MRPAPSVDACGRLRVQLLDHFDLSCENDPVHLSVGMQRLVAFLALHERTVSRSFVAGSLWIDRSQPRAGASLRSTLWRLGRHGAGLIQSTPAGLRLDDDVVVDVRELGKCARGLLTRCGDLDAPIPTGELLPDWCDEWVVFERVRLRQLQLHALEACAEQLIEQRRFAQAIDVAISAIAAEPTRESPHRLLVRAHLAEGNVSEAIARFDAYRSLLVDALDIEPTSAMTDLVATAASGRTPACVGSVR
jgi:DNA-binding SARP family transcriptional activator